MSALQVIARALLMFTTKYSKMKHTLFLLLLLPCFCLAQQATTDSKPVFNVHFDKMVMYNHNTDGKNIGSKVTVKDVIYLESGTEKKTERNTFKAYGVTIADSHRVLKADRLAYDCNSKTGSLRGHITLTENGVEKKLGRRTHMELDQNTFKLE